VAGSRPTRLRFNLRARPDQSRAAAPIFNFQPEFDRQFGKRKELRENCNERRPPCGFLFSCLILFLVSPLSG
jgi:hypothetical protein